LQGTELAVGQVHLLPKKRKERNHHGAIGEVDKVNQRKYSKESSLVGG
jgi:hypothetical protein